MLFPTDKLRYNAGRSASARTDATITTGAATLNQRSREGLRHSSQQNSSASANAAITRSGVEAIELNTICWSVIVKVVYKLFVKLMKCLPVACW